MRIQEGKAIVEVQKPKVVSREMGVFYNPVMEVNRESSVRFLKVVGKRGMRVLLPLAGSGVRGIRLALEVPGVDVWMNDGEKEAWVSMRKHARMNKVKCTITNEDANVVMRGGRWDYVDIDPFGSPNPFLDAAVQSLRAYGFLAVTATDTQPLAGSAPKACLRKYWAVGKRGRHQHEWGLRILVRKVQLIGAQYERALIPKFAYWHQHHYRVFFQCMMQSSAVNKVLVQHKFHDAIGPLFVGRLWDARIANKMALEVGTHKSFFEKLAEEAKVDALGFCDLHGLAKQEKWTDVPSLEKSICRMRKAGYKASRTHLTQAGIRTTMPKQKVVKLLSR